MKKAFVVLVSVVGLVATGSMSNAADPEAKRLAMEAYYQLEGNVFDAEEIEQAFVKLQSALHIDPDEPWVYIAASMGVLVTGYKIGDWYELKTFTEGAIHNALQYAERSTELGPNESQAYAQLARIKIIKRKYKEAWELLNRAHQLEPNSYYPWYLRGIISEKKRDASRATSYFDEAQKRAKHAFQHNNVNLHRQKVAKFSGDYAGQEQFLLENIANNSDDAYVYGNYAHFLMRQKRYDEAVMYWNKAIEKRPYPHALKQLEKAKQLRGSD